MLNHRLHPQDRETALGGNRLRRRARVGAGSSTTTGTASVQPPSAKTPPGAYADRLGVPPVPRTSLDPDASLYRLNLCSAVG